MSEELNPILLNLGRQVKKALKSRSSVLNGKKVEYFKGKDLILGLSKLKKINWQKNEREFKSIKQINDFGDE
jgi:hypothetical protein